jgi:glutaconate CoA-transferase subunit A
LSKIKSAAEALNIFLKDGDCLAIGGFVTNRRPYVLVREIIRQGRKNLYIEGGPSGGDIDMLIGAGCVSVMIASYAANSGFTQVCRRFRHAIETGAILFDDYSLDVQTIAYHGAALGLPYMPVKNMLGSDLCNIWGISEEDRKKIPKLPQKKFVIQDDPFHPGSNLCLVPTPEIDVALIHAQAASPDGTFRIIGPGFQDLDIAIAARHTIVSCEELISDEEIRKAPHLNTCTGICVDAVVPAPYGAHPTQCFGKYDYDSSFLIEYDRASRTQEDFDLFIEKYIKNNETHDDYLNFIGRNRLEALHIDVEYGYRPGMDRKQEL